MITSTSNISTLPSNISRCSCKHNSNSKFSKLLVKSQSQRSPTLSTSSSIISHSSISSGQSNKNEENRIRILVLGSSVVGKTSVIKQILYDKFDEMHNKTLHEMYSGVFSVCGEHLVLDIEDTSGTFAEDFPAMLRVSACAADAIVLVFDVTKEDTFTEVARLRELIESLEIHRNIPITIVANKSELTWSLSPDEVEATVMLDWESSFVECSAIDAKSVSCLTQEIICKNFSCKLGAGSCLTRERAFPVCLSTSSKNRKEIMNSKKGRSCRIS